MAMKMMAIDIDEMYPVYGLQIPFFSSTKSPLVEVSEEFIASHDRIVIEFQALQDELYAMIRTAKEEVSE